MAVGVPGGDHLCFYLAAAGLVAQIHFVVRRDTGTENELFCVRVVLDVAGYSGESGELFPLFLVRVEAHSANLFRSALSCASRPWWHFQSIFSAQLFTAIRFGDAHRPGGPLAVPNRRLFLRSWFISDFCFHTSNSSRNFLIANFVAGAYRS